MFSVKMHFGRLKQVDRDRQVDAITSLLAAMRHNGNLLKDYILSSEARGWTAYSLTPARDALSRNNWSESVQSTTSQLSKAEVGKPRVHFLGKVPETLLPCRCARPNWTCPQN